jgi:hypothetical protein
MKWEGKRVENPSLLRLATPPRGRHEGHVPCRYVDIESLGMRKPSVVAKSLDLSCVFVFE